MSGVQVRPFERHDRDQVTALVNAHIAAVMPNVSVSTQALLAQLEREPGEFIVDPWVVERATLVAEQRERVVAAAHLLRYDGGAHVPPGFRRAGEIRWFVFWPPAPFWPDSLEAADLLIAGCLAQLQRWSVETVLADGKLPAPGVYGLPEQWPHILELLERNGFAGDRRETIHLAPVHDIRRPLRLPVSGLRASRSVGSNGVRISAIRPVGPADDQEVLGYVEVDTMLDSGNRTARFNEWADVGNLEVNQQGRDQGVDAWLLAEAADWLELGGITRLLAYTTPEQEDEARLLRRVGFSVLTHTTLGLVRS